ncbi:hypothetical protein Tco_1327537 [Tanacetum coccineum]
MQKKLSALQLRYRTSLESLTDLSAEEKERYKADISCNEYLSSRGLKESNFDQLYAYLKQHEVHANENRMMMERFIQPIDDPLALVSNASNQKKTISERQIQEKNVIAGNVGGRTEFVNMNPGQAKPIMCNIRKGIGHIARECPQPKRPQDSDYFKDKMLLMNAHENGAVLDEEQLLFLAGEQFTNFRRNQVHGNIFSSEDPIYDEAGPSIRARILPFEYVEDNEEHVVQSNVSSVQNDALMSILDEMHEQGVQSMSTTKQIKNLEHQIQEKDNVIRHLKDRVANVNDRSRVPYNAIDVTALVEQNDCYRVELEKSLKAQLRSKEPCVTSDYVKPKVLAPGMYAIDVKPIPHPLKNNRSAHLNYISHLKESVETVREIVEEARVVKPQDSSLNYACKYTKLSQELLECVIGTCPKSFNERDNKAPSTPVTRKKQVTFSDAPGISSSNTQKHEVHQKVQQTNVHVIHSTGVNTSTEESGSKPRGNTKKNRIPPAKTENKKKVEVHPRTNKSVWTKVNRVDSSISSKRVVINSNSESVCKTCNKCLNSGNHEMCVVNILSSVNATPTVKIVLNNGKQIWKPKGKLSDNNPQEEVALGKLNCGYQWRPTGKKFALGELCPLTKLSVQCGTDHPSVSGLKLFKTRFRGRNEWLLRLLASLQAPFLKEKKGVRFSALYLQKKRNLFVLDHSHQQVSYLVHARSVVMWINVDQLIGKGKPSLDLRRFYSFQVNEHWLTLSADLLQKALNVTPADSAHPFESPPAVNRHNIHNERVSFKLVDEDEVQPALEPHMDDYEWIIASQDETIGPSVHPEDATSTKMVRETLSHADAESGGNSEKINSETDTEILNFGDEQVGSNSKQSHVALAGPNPEHMQDVFLATNYPKGGSSSGPEPFMMTPGQLNSGLAPSHVLATTNIPPTDKDLEILFQPMVDEYFEQSTDSEPVPMDTVVNAPIVSTNTSVSTTIAQDAPSISHYCHPTSASSSLLKGFCAGPTIEDTSITQADLHPSVNPVAGEPSFAQSTSGDLDDMVMFLKDKARLVSKEISSRGGYDTRICNIYQMDYQNSFRMCIFKKKSLSVTLRILKTRIILRTFNVFRRLFMAKSRHQGMMANMRIQIRGRSTSGSAQSLEIELVSWSSKKQKKHGHPTT